MQARGWLVAVLFAVALAGPARAQQDEQQKLKQEVQRLRQELDQLKQDQQDRIKLLLGELEKLKEQYAKQAKQDKQSELEALKQQMEQDAGSPEQRKQEGLLRKYVEQLIAQQRPNAFNPRITVFGDFLAAYRRRKTLDDGGREVGSRLSAREFEIDLRADIDPYAKGVLIVALGEEEPNEYEVTVEEGYLTFHNLGGLEQYGLQAKAGRFRLGFGQLNKLHLHDLPQFDYPLVIQEFLGEEGAVGDGVGLTWAVPNPFGQSITLEVEAINGEFEPLFADGPRRNIAALARLKWFKELSPTTYFEVGASHLAGRAGERGGETQLSGVDFLFKWAPEKDSQYRSLVFQAEAFALHRKAAGEEEGSLLNVDSYGAYGYVQHQFARRWYAGVRGDYTQFAADDEGNRHSVSAYLSFYTSEFLRIRFGWQHIWDSRGDPEQDVGFVQFTWVFGSHPVEPYWFNK